MQYLLDYLSSMIIGGTVFFTLITFYGQINESHMVQIVNSIVQEECASATEVMEYDFRKVGYGVTDTVKITLADSSVVRFASDIDANGSIDSVAYYLSTVPISGASNQRRRILYRRVNGQDTPMLTGVTLFRVRYYDGAGNTTTALASIRSFDVALTLESDAAVDGQYAGVVWNRTFKPNNLR
jgi:hypothetical protein